MNGPGWRKSSHSTFHSNCAEVAAWRKSSHSSGGSCAEVGQDGPVIGIRDSKLGEASPVLMFSGEAWAAFVWSLKG